MRRCFDGDITGDIGFGVATSGIRRTFGDEPIAHRQRRGTCGGAGALKRYAAVYGFYTAALLMVFMTGAGSAC